MKMLWNRVKGLLVREEWCVAIRPRTDRLLCDAGGTDAPFTVVPNSFRYWCADPFIVSDGEYDCLFFELFDRFRGKGGIGCRMIKNGKIGGMRMVYETDTHLSFPFVFCRDGNWFMIPESAKSRSIPLLQAEAFPTRWQLKARWMQGKRYADSVLLEQGGNEFLFSQPLGEKNYHFDQLELLIRRGKEWQTHPGNPIVEDAQHARMAGRIFLHKGELIRPAQDCGKAYGEKLHFRRITRFSAVEYTEEELLALSARDVKISGEKNRSFQGIHTYNASERYEVVDLKLPDRIRAGYALSVPFNLFTRFKRMLGKKGT